MFSLSTLPVHCCSTVFTLVTLLAKRTYISEYYCWYVSLQRYETEIQRRCEVQYVLQCYSKRYWQSLDKQFEITYSTTVC